MRTTDAVEAITNLIGSPQPKHLAVLFINPSEIRPGGGFIGSYADIELQLGSINSIEISDIYDPDGQLDQHVIPPEPLQQITKDWEARDANWFFDYPTSAKKIIGFLNNSKIYQEKEVIFDAAISINTNVLEDLMTLIGPVELKEYKLTITPENFLSELQREVESGADKKVNQPKKILKVLAPIILEQLTTLDSAEKQSLARMLRKHSTDRDIMLYFNDKTLQRYVQSQGIGGEILAPRNGAVNEYLAVVNANIGGAKSDAFIKQGIDFKASINELGEISNVLTVTREHTGKKEKDWWYRATNRNYLQIYTPAGSRLQRSTGRSIWPRDPKYNYKNYSTDPDISTIADTQRYRDEFGIDRMIISGKTVFAAWFNTTAGAKSTFVLEYKNPYRLSPDSEIPYEFVFEKQSGANTTLSISIAAPPKYRWKEINKSVIEYKTDDPPGRIRIRQTLIPIE